MENLPSLTEYYYQTNPIKLSPSWEAQMVKKFPNFYGRSTAVSTREGPLSHPLVCRDADESSLHTSAPFL